MDILKLREKKYYILTVELNGKILNYTCKILDQNSEFIYFIDKFKRRFTFAKKCIVSYEELESMPNFGGSK